MSLYLDIKTMDTLQAGVVGLEWVDEKFWWNLGYATWCGDEVVVTAGVTQQTTYLPLQVQEKLPEPDT